MRRPTLWGHHGCGFRMPSAFRHSSVLLSAVQPFAVKLCTGPELCVISPWHPPDSGSVTPLKIHQFSSLFPGQQKPDKASNKQQKSTPECIKNDFYEKLTFAEINNAGGRGRSPQDKSIASSGNDMTVAGLNNELIYTFRKLPRKEARQCTTNTQTIRKSHTTNKHEIQIEKKTYYAHLRHAMR